MSHSAAEKLTAKLKHAHLLHSVADLLQWDEQVNLPPDSSDRRAEQLAAMAGLTHEAATDPEIGILLGDLEADPASLAPDERVLSREARRDYDRATRLPTAFVAEKASLDSAAFHAWREARAASDFGRFAPFLEKQVEMARREAAYLGYESGPYDYLIDKHDPGMTEATVATLFDGLRAGLLPLVQRILSSPVRPQPELLRGFPVGAQEAFLREVTTAMGFNYRRGRIDVAVHPFCSGDGADTRLTTRFHEDMPLDSLFSAIHEAGHGLYEQGLPLEHIGTPLGQAAGMALHESQSRLWENQVARSRGFWACFEPKFRAAFSRQLADVSSDALYLAINAVKPTLIRVDADEVTYNLHILLRFEIERRLFSGALAVADLPATWNRLSEEILGLVPDSDATGVLQDVHWSGGAFGYFPSYCLGNMVAAQLWPAILRTLPGLEEDFARGDFSGLLGWLRDNIHAHGRRHDTRALVRQATGEDLSPVHLVRYLEERYAPLYLPASR